MSEPFVLDSEQLLTLQSWKEEQANFIAGFTTKNGGVSKGHFTSLNTGLHVLDDVEAVRKNKGIIGDIISFPTSCWVGCEQIHDDHIVKVDSEWMGKGVNSYDNAVPKTDGIYTDRKNILLTLCFADCVPLYFYAPNHSLVGLAHAGWKGTVKNIGAKMIEMWRNEGVDPAEIKAAIGPSISAKAYVVDDYVITRVKEALPLPSYESIFREISEGQYELDLKRVNKELLMQAGVKEEHISCSSFCTSSDDALFFSHRRDKGKTGRMMSFIGMKGDQHIE